MRSGSGGQAGFAGGVFCGGRGANRVERPVCFAPRGAGRGKDYSGAEIADVVVGRDFCRGARAKGASPEDRGERSRAEAGSSISAGASEISAAGDVLVRLR